MMFLVISNLFPRPDQEQRGLFNAQLFQAVEDVLQYQRRDEIRHVETVCLVPEWRIWRWRTISRWGVSECQVSSDKKDEGKGKAAAFASGLRRAKEGGNLKPERAEGKACVRAEGGSQRSEVRDQMQTSSCPMPHAPCSMPSSLLQVSSDKKDEGKGKAAAFASGLRRAKEGGNPVKLRHGVDLSAKGRSAFGGKPEVHRESAEGKNQSNQKCLPDVHPSQDATAYHAPCALRLAVRYLPVFYLPLIGRSWSWLTYAWSMRKLKALVEQSDVVFSTWLYPDGVAATRFAYEAGKPAWIMVQGSDTFHLRNPVRRSAILDACKKAVGIICVWQGLKDRLVEAGVDPAKIHVVPNGVDAELFRYRDRNEARKWLQVQSNKCQESIRRGELQVQSDIHLRQGYCGQEYQELRREGEAGHALPETLNLSPVTPLLSLSPDTKISGGELQVQSNKCQESIRRGELQVQSDIHLRQGYCGQEYQELRREGEAGHALPETLNLSPGTKISGGELQVQSDIHLRQGYCGQECQELRREGEATRLLPETLNLSPDTPLLSLSPGTKISGGELQVQSDIHLRQGYCGQEYQELRREGEATRLLPETLNLSPVTPLLSLSPDTPIVLFVGNLVPVKGPDILLSAWKELKRKAEGGNLKPEKESRKAEGKEVRADCAGVPGCGCVGVGSAGNQEPRTKNQEPILVLLGSGPMRKKLEHQAKDLGIADSVFFLGSRPPEEVALWMNAADCLCLTSRSEGMPNVVLEALASGLPVVATDVGAVGEILAGEPAARVARSNECGNTGVSGGRGSSLLQLPTQLTEALSEVMAMPADRIAMAARCRERHSWALQARTILDLIWQGLARRSSVDESTSCAPGNLRP